MITSEVPERKNINSKSTLLIKIIREFYFHHDGSAKWSIANIEALLTETDLSFIQRHWERTHQLKTLQLLYSLQQALKHDIKRLAYNFLRIHKYVC